MSSCCEALATEFDETSVARDRRRLERRGPPRTTRWLIELVGSRMGSDATVLDIGGGLGSVQEGLLSAGAASAVSVDASPAYTRAASRRAEERGYGDRVERHVADFAEGWEAVSAADAVTLDRVICCYPEMERLVARSATRARRVYGIVVPRDHLPNRAGVAVVNALRRLVRKPFRAYVHRLAAIEGVAARAGLRPVARRRTLGWVTVVFVRVGP